MWWIWLIRIAIFWFACGIVSNTILAIRSGLIAMRYSRKFTYGLKIYLTQEWYIITVFLLWGFYGFFRLKEVIGVVDFSIYNERLSD